jgi:hypothetical protein
VLGFVLGVFVYIVAFLRCKADVGWAKAVLSSLAAVALFVVLGHMLVLHYPEGLLQYWFELPWPLD